MSIIAIEGSNCSGKSTLIDYLVKYYNFKSSKSVPEWFRPYIPFARELQPQIQRKIYEIGHIAAYYNALKEKKCTIFDRCYFSTYIRLSYQESKTVNECVDQIASFHYKPDLIIVLTVPKEIMEQRLVERNKQFNQDFFEYENSVYLQLSLKYDNIILVDNSKNIKFCTNEILRKIKGR